MVEALACGASLQEFESLAAPQNMIRVWSEREEARCCSVLSDPKFGEWGMGVLGVLASLAKRISRSVRIRYSPPILSQGRTLRVHGSASMEYVGSHHDLDVLHVREAQRTIFCRLRRSGDYA